VQVITKTLEQKTTLKQKKKPFQDNFHLFENRELFTMFLYSGRKVNDGTFLVPMTLVK
jgi:hypothetical protein